MSKKRGFCWNSRRWLDFAWFDFNTCPPETCIYKQCGYYEEREPTAWYKYKEKALKSYNDAEGDKR